ncbi:ABC transporter permease [Catenulispora rubra]|uniref:ABC transporter permease n=1 Tax=Catenulispora rubra TaxID=280293 RepID=UPI00189284AE|nr:ABC transporter permease [Catenulispora rubra]
MSVYQITSSLRARTRRRVVSDPVMAVAAVVLALVIAVAVFAPLLAPYDPNAVDPMNVLSGPSAAHWLGTDDTGRDILSRLLYGSRPSLIAPAVVVVASTGAGTLLAVAGAWWGGWADRLVGGLLDLVFCFPGLIMAVVAAAVFGPGLPVPVAAISIAYLPFLARVLRAAAQKELSLPYMAALKLLGLPTHRIWLRHLLPNLMPVIVVQATVTFGYALLDVASISFIGLGAQPPQAEWGLMVSSGYAQILSGQAGQVIFAGAAIVIVVVACNLLGSGLSRRLLGEDL